MDCENRNRHCGGCPLLGLPYQKQLADKQRNLQELLGKYAPVLPIMGAEQPLHYRNKAISTFAEFKGRLTSGIYAVNSHRVLPVNECLLHMPILDKTIEAVRQSARACKMEAFNEDKYTGLLRHCLVRCSADQSQVLVVVVTAAEEWPGRRNFVQTLRKKAPWVQSIVQNVNARETSAVLGPNSRVLFGSGHITDSLLGVKFALSAGSFYQVNPVQTERLYKTALDFAGLTGTETVVDAYCGIGTIGLCAASRAGQVIGVELAPGAARDAAANARRNKVENARFVQGDATAWMVDSAEEGARADVVFLDPPRAGSTAACIEAVAKLQPSRVVYISCNPETLARDVGMFSRHGYRAKKFQPVDLFCQTEHVETVCLLAR